MSSGGGGGVDYQLSPEQRAMMRMFMPTLAQMYGYEYTPGAGGGAYGPDYGGGASVGGAGGGYRPQQDPGGGDKTGPSDVKPTGGGKAKDNFLNDFTYTGAPWEPPVGLSPTADWFSSLSPELMAGVWAPYEDAANQLGERIYGGGGSSARDGSVHAGSSAAAFGDFYGRAGQQIGQDAWGYGAEQRQALMLPYTGALAGISGTYPDAVVQPPGTNPFAAIGAGVGAYGMSTGNPYLAAGGYGMSYLTS